MLATPADAVPTEQGWAFELKWDGIRAIGEVRSGSLRLVTRNGNDVTARWPALQALAEATAERNLVLDGEVVAFDDAGRPSFSALQGHGSNAPVAYLLFDVLHVDGRSTRSLPWERRREVLEDLDLNGICWQTPTAHRDNGEAVLEASKSGGLEGVVAKRIGSLYVPGRRTRDWLKIKNTHRQEFVVGGWLEGKGARSARVGALLLGYYEGDALLFAGKVGTGFTDKELERLDELFRARARETSPFAVPVPHKKCRWTDPDLVAEVEFTEWTHLGTLRHPSYKGLRFDKPVGEVVKET